MKNVNYILNGVLLVAVIILFILQFGGRKGNKTNEGHAICSDSVGYHLPMAYIRTDSLLNNYRFSKDLNESIMTDLENQRAVLRDRQIKLQKGVEDFQHKVQMNAYISQERAQQEYDRLERQRGELEKYAADSEQELSIKQVKMQQQLQDTILNALKIFNTPRKYELIFSNIGTDNLFYAEDSYDITQEIIEFLNVRYKPVKE
jgi:outer membrane protein